MTPSSISVDAMQPWLRAAWERALAAPPSLGVIAAIAAGTALLLVAVGALRRRRMAVADLAIVDAPVPVEAEGGDRKESIPVLSSDAPLICNGRRSPAGEAFRGLRTQLLLLAREGKLKHLLITSAGPGEGKTMVAANLAMATARAGHRVLLVDADVHRPRLHEYIGCPNSSGLVDVLSGSAGGSAAATARQLLRSTEMPGLSFLAAGTLPHDVTELLAGKAMMEVVAELGSEYELVIYDSPPVLSVADAAVLASHMDGVLLVVRTGRYPRDAIQRAHAELKAVHANVIGVVLNGVESGAGGAYYGHYKYSYYA